MVAYVEGAERAGYPTSLLNVSRAVDLPDALCSLTRPETRKCLRGAALRGAAISSPMYSALELVVALCEVFDMCKEQALQGGERAAPSRR